MRNGFDTLLQAVQNDHGYDLSFSLQDSSGVALDISNATLAFNAQAESDYTIQFDNPMAVVNASGGLCKYTVQATDFVTSGNWTAQIVVTYNTGEVLTFSGITIVVTAALPIS